MRILKNRLAADDGTPLRYIESPNRGGSMVPEVLVMHYTAGSSAESAIAWLCNPAAKASAHLVIGRDGGIAQLVPFNRVAWHAGQSRWAGRSGVNAFSIGIELDNAGRLDRVGKRWISPLSRREYADDEVFVGKHKDDGWHDYSAAQIEAALAVGLLLMRSYSLKDVVGHEDIAPGRKSDPGPAFPMAAFRSRLLGRADDAPEPYVTSAALNVRAGPGSEFAILPGSPLPVGTRVALLEQQGLWWRVDVQDTANGVMDLLGWCHSRYLKRE